MLDRFFCFCFQRRVAFICLASFFVFARRGVCVRVYMSVCVCGLWFFLCICIKRNVFAGCCRYRCRCCLTDFAAFYCTIPFGHCRTQLHFNEHGAHSLRPLAPHSLSKLREGSRELVGHLTRVRRLLSISVCCTSKGQPATTSSQSC